MSEQTTNYSTALPSGQFDESTIKLEERRLQDTVARNYLRLMSRTQRLETVNLSSDPRHVGAGYEFEVKHATTFVVLPRSMRQDRPHWLIELLFLTTQTPAYGIEAAGDVVLGMMRYGNKKPDLDLSLYGAKDKGVSRRHALLRPELDKLSVFDLSSTNGTWINGARINPHEPCTLCSGDILSLGMLTFALRIVSTPDDLGNGNGHGGML